MGEDCYCLQPGELITSCFLHGKHALLVTMCCVLSKRQANGWPTGKYLAMTAKCAIAKSAKRARALRFCPADTGKQSARTVVCCRFIEAMVLTLSVKHGQSIYQVTETEDAGVSMLMQHIEELTGVPVRCQKLICQGKVLDTAATLKALKVKNGSKLMLISSGSQTQVTPALSAVSSLTHKLICDALL